MNISYDCVGIIINFTQDKVALRSLFILCRGVNAMFGERKLYYDTVDRCSNHVKMSARYDLFSALPGRDDVVCRVRPDSVEDILNYTSISWDSRAYGWMYSVRLSDLSDGDIDIIFRAYPKKTFFSRVQATPEEIIKRFGVQRGFLTNKAVTLEYARKVPMGIPTDILVKCANELGPKMWKHELITWDMVCKCSKSDVDWNALSENPNITYEIVMCTSGPNLHPDTRCNGKLPWTWSKLFGGRMIEESDISIPAYPNLSVKYIESVTHDYEWSILSRNLKFDILAELYHRPSGGMISWEAVSRRWDLSIDFIISHDYLPWEFDKLSSSIRMSSHEFFSTLDIFIASHNEPLSLLWDMEKIYLNPRLPWLVRRHAKMILTSC